MSKVLIFSENNSVIEKYSQISEGKFFNFAICKTENELQSDINDKPCDVYLIDSQNCPGNLKQIIQGIKNVYENAQIILLSPSNNIDNDILSDINGYICDNYSDNMIFNIINTCIKTKSKLDKLTIRNADMKESLYRLNVLYNTSSQFAGTLDTKNLLTYMTDGLERSLSFDLSCTISFGFENEPVLIIHSLYDVSEELTNALKFRAVLNYKSLFENQEIPFEIDDTKLKIVKDIKNPHEKFTFSIFQYDNMFAPIDLGDQFFGCIEIFRNKAFTSDDAAYFQTIVRQVSLPLKSAGLYKEIKEKNIELEKLERIKSNFVSIVSHELRTPLTPLKNALSILSSGRCGEFNKDGIHFLDMAKRNVSQLINIINDILDLNKIEAGMMIFKYKKMNIHTIIENVKNNFINVAKENNIEFHAEEQGNLPDIYGDSQRLEQILTNLVSNAIKFTPENKHITIKSELRNSSEIIPCKYFEEEIKSLKGDYIVVSVKDEGIGMKDENIPKAFEMFSQIENSLTRKVGGTGLGLPIVKGMVKAHKGALWCESEEGNGSSFYFAIPVCSENSEIKTVQKEIV